MGIYENKINPLYFLIRLVIHFLSKLFRWVAVSGIGSDICLKNGFLPLPVHYFYPIPDISDLEKRNIWEKKSDLAGIDFRSKYQIQFMLELGRKYGEECNWSPNPKEDIHEFYTENESFSFGCAAALHAIIRNFRPKRIIEIGSGNSSKVISAALKKNVDDGLNTGYTIIDPYPSELVKNLPLVFQIIEKRVEETEFHQFSELGENDILFIDSGHTVRTGGDVNFLFLDILPRLSPGVIVHIHDIGLPYEYSKTYFTRSTHRFFWTEAYLLQAFLSLNPHYEIMLAMNFLTENHWDDFCKAFPHFNPDIHKARSVSFWIRRIS